MNDGHVFHEIICSEHGGNLARRVLNGMTSRIGNDHRISIHECNFGMDVDVHIAGHDCMFWFSVKDDRGLTVDNFVERVCTTLFVCHPSWFDGS